MKDCHIAVVLVLCLCCGARAQPLADRIPADALIYVGWAGTRAMGPKFETSHLRTMIDASNFIAVYEMLLPALIERAGAEEPEAVAPLQLIGRLGGSLWRHPSAFYLGEVDPKSRLPAMALLIDADQDSADLEASIEQLIAEIGAIPIPPQVRRREGLVALTIGPVSKQLEALISPEGGADAPAIAGETAFRSALKQVSPEPAAVVYANIRGAVAMIDRLVEADGNPRRTEDWQIPRDAFGLGGLHQLIWTGSFVDRKWATHAFVQAPAPRRGLAILLDAPPLDDSALDMLPKSTRWGTVGRFDFVRLFDEVRAGLERAEPDKVDQFDQGMEQVSAMLELNVRDDLLAALGDTWATYIDREVGGTTQLGWWCTTACATGPRLTRRFSVLSSWPTACSARWAAATTR